MRNTTELSYRIAAVDSANPICLLLAMYDTLAGDLLRAAEAIHANNIELRCAELNHAYTVLAHLESWLDSDRVSKRDESLRAFYGYLRARMLEASIKKSAPMLDELVELTLQIRSAWQQRESLSNRDHTVPATPQSSLTPSLLPERVALSHSA